MTQIGPMFVCGSDPWDDDGFEDEPGTVDWDTMRAGYDALSDLTEEWQGLPVAVPGQYLQLHDRHPLARAYDDIDRSQSGVEMGFVCGGPDIDERAAESIVNAWYSWKLNATIQIWRQVWPDKPPKFFAIRIPRSPDSSMQRFAFWMNTIGASDAWDVDAEHRARDKLRGMLSDRQWRHYDLTGSFIETSPRSRLTYVFRRLRPTIALTPRWPYGRAVDSMRCLAVLCLHPLGYYRDTWAGAMVPSDDVLAHLAMMRGDEAYFWRCANAHDPRTPEAGL